MKKMVLLVSIYISTAWKQHINFYNNIFFLNVGPPKEDIFSGHLLSPVFSVNYTHITITGSFLIYL